MENETINVRINERKLFLEFVDEFTATFQDRNRYQFAMPRTTWRAKGRPEVVTIQGEVSI